MKSNNLYHTPVLLQEAVDALNIQKENKYIDATLGGGGHSEEIIEKQGLVLGIDQDEDSVKACSDKFTKVRNIKIVKGNFRDIEKIAKNNEFYPCSGILFDLGTSVHQLSEKSRGFSFSGHEKLDMRMDRNLELTAFEIVNNWPKGDLIDVFEKYGEENEAETIANEIIKRRKVKEINYADDLSAIISEVKKRKEPGINPATKIFQSLRIAVNDELGALKEAIAGGVSVLGKNGRMVIISFHSLEDRIVKSRFNELEDNGLGKVIIKKPVRASSNEVNKNRKARSAKMRVFEKN